jgi:lipopolysaccharide transport system ATP-binding protein
MRSRDVSILFVSHDLDLVTELCDRAIWLGSGQVHADGDPCEVVNRYIQGVSECVPRTAQIVGRDQYVGQRRGSGEIEITQVRLLDRYGSDRSRFYTCEPFSVQIRYRAHCRIAGPVFGIAVYTSDGVWVIDSNTYAAGQPVEYVQGEGLVQFTMQSLPLLDGNYFLSATVVQFADEGLKFYDHLDRVLQFSARQRRQDAKLVSLIEVPGQWECRALG